MLISATDPVTVEVIAAAQKRLSQILGPASSFIVETAAKDSATASELFERLSAELDDQDEREFFLSIVVDAN